MATTLTLYKGVDLNNKYQDVFDSQTTLETYLSDKVSATITGDWYFKMSGDFNLPVSGYADTPNYMKAADTVSGNTSYYFIRSYEVYNAIYKISYLLDVWHTYLPVLKIKDGVRNLASSIIGSYADIPYEMIEEKVTEYSNYNYDVIKSTGTYTIFARGYFWQGDRPSSGLPSKATQFFTYGGEARSNDELSTITTGGAPVAGAYRNVLTASINMIQAFSALDVATMYDSWRGEHWKFEITNVWIIPYTALTPMSSSGAFYHWYTTAEFLKGCELQGDAGSATADHVTVYSTADNSASGTSYNFYLFTSQAGVGTCDKFTYTSPIYNKKICEQIGIGRGALPIPHRIYKDAHTIEELLNFGPGGVSLYLIDGTTNIDFGPMLEMNPNFEPERAEVAEQRKNNWIQSAVSTALGMGTSIAGDAMSGNVAGLAMDAVNGVGSIASLVTQYKNASENTISERQAASDANLQTYYAFDGMYYDIINYSELVNNYKLCGLVVNVPSSGTDFTDGDSYSYNVIGYETVNICGEMPEQYKDVYETILKNGTRVWNNKAMNDNILHPLSTSTSVPDVIPA